MSYKCSECSSSAVVLTISDVEVDGFIDETVTFDLCPNMLAVSHSYSDEDIEIKHRLKEVLTLLIEQFEDSVNEYDAHVMWSCNNCEDETYIDGTEPEDVVKDILLTL